MVKFISAEEAIDLIQDGANVGFSGFSAFGCPEGICRALGKSYSETGHPKNLTVVSGVSTGNLQPENAGGCGFSHLTADGLLSTIITSNVTMAPEMGPLVGGNKIGCFIIPLGVISHIFRAMAGKKPGVLTHVGLHTFADPRLEGCKGNQKAVDSGREVVRLISIDGKDYLLYLPLPMDICFIRGTYADEDGNISMEEEALLTDQREMATAVHNNGGIVVVQVKDIVRRGSLDSRKVAIHKSCVDYVVKASAESNIQCYAWPDIPVQHELLGVKKVPLGSIPPMKLNARKVIARRAAMELIPDAMVNLGIGIADGVASVANEEGIADRMTLSIESGAMGGVPTGGAGLGACVNPDAVYSMADNMDLYDGGGLDLAYLSAAEVDAQGNVNVSKFGSRITGPGGFINISQNTPTVCFLGTFTVGKSKLEIGNGKLIILEDGSGIKFRKQVDQITFSARYAQESGQNILYITERAVFRLTQNGLLLTEIAPGIDLQRDILDKMEFLPQISDDLKTMDARIFTDSPMGLHF